MELNRSLICNFEMFIISRSEANMTKCKYLSWVMDTGVYKIILQAFLF